MAANTKMVSPVLFFFVFIVLATHLVHGNHEAYYACMSICHGLEITGNPVAAWACSGGCSLLKNGIDQPGSNKFETDEFVQNFVVKAKILTGLLVNNGVAIFEANPNTFMAPGHWDADALFFVAQGKATINLIRQDKKETLGLKTGDIIRIPSGTKVMMINKDSMEKLVVIKFPQPVSTPAAGHSEVNLLNPFRDQSSQQQQLAEVITSVI